MKLPSWFSLKAALFIPRDAKFSTEYPPKSQVQQIIFNAEKQRFTNSLSSWVRSSPRISGFLFGVAGISLLLGITKGWEQTEAKKEIEFRKQQLVQPVYELKDNEAFQFPWGKANLDEWLYRPVRITGRPIHNKAMLVPRTVDGYKGFDYILPLVTKENEDGSIQEGVLLNKGWIPHEYAHIGARWRIENALPQTFDCYVSLNSEIDEKGSFFKKGNAPGARFNKWTHVYLPDMAKASGLKNEDIVKLALLERVNHQTVLDERDPKHFQINLIGSEDYPFEKTRAGALQLRHMPWDLNKQSRDYFLLSLLSGGLGLALRKFA